jgi:chromosome segregation ATPase
MPNLIYNVKFEVDSSGLEKINNFGVAGASQSFDDVNKSVNRTRSSTSQYSREIQDLVKDTNEVVSANARAKASIDLRRKASQDDLRVVVKTNQLAQERIKSIREERMALINHSNTAELNTEERTKLNRTIARLEIQERQFIVALQQGREQLKGTASDTQNLSKVQQYLQNQMKQSGHSFDMSNKSLATSNQLMFSFSDLVQDSTQFSQGFAQGMRAIGNNVGFTAELFFNLQRRVDEYNKTLTKSEIAQGKAKTVSGELTASLKGAGGALIAINAAVMVATIGFQLLEKRLKDAEERAKAQVEVLSEVAKTFSELDTGVPDPFGMRSRQRQINILSQNIGDTVQDVAQKTAEAQKTIGEAMAGGSEGILGTINSMFVSFQASITKTLFPTALKIGAAFDKMTEQQLIALKANEELRIEIEKQQKVQEAYTAFLNQDGNAALKLYVDTLKQLEQQQALINASSVVGIKGISKQSVSRLSLIEDLRNQIIIQQQILNSEHISDEQREKSISLISQLSSTYKQLSEDLENNRRQVEDITFKNTAFLNESQKIDYQVFRQIESLDKLALKYPELTAEIDAAKRAILDFAAAQKESSAFSNISQLAGISGELGEIFGASKEFRLAMASIDGAAAVIGVLADPTLGFVGKLTASATIVAQVARQIQQIKKTKIGSGGGIAGGGSSGGISPISSSKSGVSEPTQQISFLPNAARSGQAPPTIDVKIDRAGLAVAVGKGGREIGNKQVRV